MPQAAVPSQLGDSVMNLLKDFIFLDCLLIDFEIDRHLQLIGLRCEAYLPLQPEQEFRALGVINVRLAQCTVVRTRAKMELWEDLEKPYSGGDTCKANEIILISLSVGSDQVSKLELSTDMVDLYVECKVVSIVQGAQ